MNSGRKTEGSYSKNFILYLCHFLHHFVQPVNAGRAFGSQAIQLMKIIKKQPRWEKTNEMHDVDRESCFFGHQSPFPVLLGSPRSKKKKNEDSARQERRIVRETLSLLSSGRIVKESYGEGAREVSPTSTWPAPLIALLTCTPYIMIALASRQFSAK